MKSFTLVLVMLIGLISLNADNYSVNFDINDLSTTINAMKFHEFKLADCSATREIGHPKLPCKVVSYIIPVNMKVSNLSISENSILLKGTFNVMPVQTPEFENGENVDFTPPDSTIYAHNMIYPYSSAQIVSHSYMDGANNIVSIALFPLRYNPVTGVVTFANNISISFNYVPSSEQPLYPTKRFAIDTPKYDAYLYNLVENPNDIATHRNLSNIEIDPSGPEDFNYLIICPDDVVDLEQGEENPFAEFINWKEQKGHRVRLLTYNQIASSINAGNGDDIGTYLINDIPGKVRKYLKHHWENHGLANVLIVGGKDDPKRYAHQMSQLSPPINSQIPSDLYFSDYNGDWNNDNDPYECYGEFSNSLNTGLSDQIDYLQEVFIGRVILPPIIDSPAGSPTRKQAIKNWSEKLITYEKGPGNGFVGYTDYVYYVTSNEITTSAYNTLIDNGFRGRKVESEMYGEVLRPSGSTVIANINEYLPGIIIFSAHGNKCRIRIADNDDEYDSIANSITSVDGYVHPSYSYENESNNGIDDLSNPYQMYSLVIAKSCNTAQYDYAMNWGNEDAYPSMAEAFTTFIPSVGGPLWLGNTRNGIISSTWEYNFVNNVFASDVNTSYPEANPWNAGAGFATARFQESLGSYAAHSMHYFGDPDIDIWSANPGKLRVEIIIESNSVCLYNENGNVIENGRIVFQSDTQKSIVYTNNNGIATTDIVFKKVSAFKHNSVPDFIRVIRGTETISSAVEQACELETRVIVPESATLILDGDITLLYKSQIIVEGELRVISNSVVTGTIASNQYGENKITVNGRIFLGTNVEFMAPIGKTWNGLIINSQDNLTLNNCSFLRTPLEINNTTAQFNSCDLSDALFTASSSNVIFNDCNINNCNNSVNQSTISYSGTDGLQSNIDCSDSDVIILDGIFIESPFTISGNLYMNGTEMQADDCSHGGIETLNSVVNIENCIFNNNSILCRSEGFHQSNVSVYFSNNMLDTGGIELVSIPNYTIIDNTITDAYSYGISIKFSGNSGTCIVENNTIENNGTVGIYLWGSYCDIKDSNHIQFNDSYGIMANSFSSWSLVGNNQHNFAHQIIRDNTNFQLWMHQNSTPDIVRFNNIQNNNHNSPWVKINQNPNNMVDIRYNYWGNNFHPEQDLIPFSSFDFEPIWIPGNIPYIEETTAASLYRIAYNHELTEEFAEAIADYKQLISEFPDTEQVVLAAKALLRIEEKKKYKTDWSSDFNTLKNYYNTENNLRLTNDFEFITNCLSTKCDIKLENYEDAISFYENVIDDPPSVIDSICAIIDLGHVYLLIDDDKNQTNYVGKKPQFKVTSFTEWESRVNTLLTLLDNEILNEEHNIPSTVTMIRNYPNPFNPTTNISFALPNDEHVKLEVYNIKGQKVKILVNENLKAGEHNVVWNGKNTNNRKVASGVYFYRLTTSKKHLTHKMIMMK